MKNIPIGPGRLCFECGFDYGQHLSNCSVGIKEAHARQAEKLEDSISKTDLLRRVEALEELTRGLRK